ncbi:MAG: AbrB/MazE/SpoVT family DNA-binding domain-containing protein [Magnetococcus sp. DMHC-1]|nr:AbrB/MazE/SpoVT family DNA-binding domain-containing protein [Magnetococcales bacterium]
MRINGRGQVTIPQALRERFGLLPHTEVEFVDRNGELVLIKNSQDRQSRLCALRGQIKSSLSTDEIMAFLRD